jgi:hypothetical protein
MTERNTATPLEKVWKRIDPTHYYEAGEIAILRAYFGLQPRPGDLSLAELYEVPADEAADADPDTPRTGPIRLRHVQAGGPVNELNEAVARICLAEVQDRLPQWWSSSAENGVVIGRARFAAPERTFTPLNPERLLCINWADSGPGFSWPEEYNVTLLPGFGRYVLTASADSPDSYGVTDFALGWFRAAEDRMAGSKRLLVRWWREAAKHDGGPWAYLFSEGLIDVKEAYRMRRLVWGDREE